VCTGLVVKVSLGSPSGFPLFFILLTARWRNPVLDILRNVQTSVRAQYQEAVLVRRNGTRKRCQELAQELLRSREASSRLTVRDLALISGFAGILVADGYVSSLARTVTRTTDTFFLIAALFTVLALMTRKHWTSTLLALVTGLIFLATPGAPFPPHITLSLIANGIVFDLALLFMLSRSTGPEPTRNQLAVAGTLGNMVMAITALAALTITVGVNIPLNIWPAIILADAFIGLIGVFFGYLVAKRLHVSRLRYNPVY